MWNGDFGLGLLALAVVVIVGVAVAIVFGILVFGFTAIGREARRPEQRDRAERPPGLARPRAPTP